MGMFDFLKILQKPQSIATGALTGFARQFPELVGNDQGGDRVERKSNNDWIKSQKALGLDTSDIEKQYGVSNGTQGIDSILSGISAGWKGDLSPSTVLGEELAKSGQKPDLGDKAFNTFADVTMDPLMAVGGLLGAAGKLGKAGEAATTIGKLEKGASLGERGAQFGRRFQQGMMATGEPVSAAGTAVLGGFAENRIAPRLRAISELLSRTPGNVGKVAEAEQFMNPAALDMGRLFDPADVASIAKNTGTESAVMGVGDKVALPGQLGFQDIPVTPKMPPDATPGLEDELMKLLQPKPWGTPEQMARRADFVANTKKPKVLIDPMIEDQDIVSQILNNAGRRRG